MSRLPPIPDPLDCVLVGLGHEGDGVELVREFT
jgi:hypothetical protein